MKKISVCYVVLCLTLCLIPFVGMAVARTDTTTENKTLASLPEFVDGRKINMQYLSELGEYFTDHFAFRQNLVAADSLMSSRIFGISSVDTVLVGADGWLYYTDTLDDYLGRNLLSERGIFNAANNLRQMQDYVRSMGSSFLLTVAPNKNSLYGEHMPYYEQYKVSSESNIARLAVWLERLDVSYLDLFEMFEEQEEVLYFKRDSHWNNQGARMVYNGMMDQLGLPHDSYANVSSEQREDYIGDLNSMIYPLNAVPEKNIYYDMARNYEYVTPTQSVEEAWIQTVNQQAEGSLFMYRDSFGNSLLPFAANAFGTAWFSKMVPYNLQMHLEQYRPETVIVEKVERNLDEFAFQPPILQGMQAELSAELEVNRMEAVTKTTLEVSETEANRMYWQFAGKLDPSVVGEDTRVYICLTNNFGKTVYEAFTVSTEESDNGYVLYLKKENLAQAPVTVEIFVENGGSYTGVYRQDVDISEIPAADLEDS